MSNRYEASGTTTVAPAANAAWMELRNTAARRIYVEEIGFFLGVATATRLLFGRAAAQGAGGTAALGQSEDPNAPTAAASVFSAAFTTSPTVPTVPMRRMSLPASIGAGVIFTWPQSDRLIIPPSGSVAIFAQAATQAATTDFYAVWTE